MNLTRGINLRKIAEMMPGASGAEVKVCVKAHVDRALTLSVPNHLGCRTHSELRRSFDSHSAIVVMLLGGAVVQW